MRTLLVIDDEPNIVYSFKSTLTSQQLTVISAGTAREGIELLKSQRPDVVMLDVRLPDMTGLQAYERIRQLDERIPVIIMTANGSEELVLDSLHGGAANYVMKRKLETELPKIIEKMNWVAVKGKP